MAKEAKITSRERTAILQSLGAGVVPAIGLRHIQVARRDEVAALLKDMENLQQGGATVRFVVGPFGSGKTFFLHLIRNTAMERGFAVMQSDITNERRLHGSDGQARALYTELMRNLSTQSRPDGGALQNLVEGWVDKISYSVRDQGGKEEDVKRQLQKALRPLQELVGGFDFTTVLTHYYEGFLAQNQALQDSALRWLRGEFSTKTEANRALGVRNIVDDDSIYDYLKLFAAFVRAAGYAGLIVNFDELVILSHRVTNAVTRNKNFEAILRIVNDCFQGHAEGIGFLFAGTVECLEDPHRGLFSDPALARRLKPNRFAADGERDLSSPVIRLANLSKEDCGALLHRVRHVHAAGESSKYMIPDAGIKSFLKLCSDRMGADFFLTPGEIVKDFVGLLNVLEQDASADWKTVLARTGRQKSDESAGAAGRAQPSDVLKGFRLE